MRERRIERPAHEAIPERVERRMKELQEFCESRSQALTLEETAVLAVQIARIEELLEAFAEIEIPEEHRQGVFKEIHRIYRGGPRPRLGVLYKLKHPFENFLFYNTDYKG